MRRLLPLALLGATLLAACGRDEPAAPDAAAPEPGTVVGTVSKGPLHGATVVFYPLGDDGLASGPAYDVGTATTDTNGKFTASGLPTNVPVLVQTSGGSYFDESDPAANRSITFGTGDHLEAVLPPGATFMTITPYSMALYKQALQQAGGANFGEVYEAVRAQATAAFGFDPVTTTPANPLTGLGGSTAGGAPYGILLGAAALAINQSAVSAGQLPTYAHVIAFIDDLSDGRYDGGDLDTLIRRFRNNNVAAYAATPAPAVNQDLLSNHPPLAFDDAYVTAPDTALTVPPASGVLANDFDGDGGTLTALRVSAPASGAVTLNADGGFTFTPASGFTGTATFTYRASDGSSGSNLATVTITVSSQALLYGAWAMVDGSGNLLTERVLAFFAGGKYLYGGHDNDPNCDTDPGTDISNASDPDGNGAEYGTYSWDPLTGDFSTGVIRETNGTCGFYSPNPAETNLRNLAVDNGDLLFDGAVRFRRVPSTLGAIKGAFLLDGSLDADGPFVVAFFPDTGPNIGRFFMVDAMPDGAGTTSGIEEGCYSVDTSTDVFVPDLSGACANAIDTTDEAGFGGDPTPPAWTLEAADSERLLLHPDDLALPVVLTRLPLSSGADRPQDADFDGLSNDQESQFETDPLDADTDGDTFSDFVEVNQDGDPNNYDPASGDSDPHNSSDVPGNDSPSLDLNFGLTTDTGATTTISTLELSASDVDSATTDITFTVTTPPAHGTIEVLGLAATSFTQTDLEFGSVSYVHDGTSTTSDSFAFTLADASGFSADCPSPAPCMFAITVNPGPGSLPLLPYFTGSGHLELFDPLDLANPTSIETALPTGNFQSRTLLVGDVAGGVVSNIHASRIVYVKDDGSTRTLWKVNLEPGASRTPVRVSNHANICRINGIAEDFVNAENTFLRLDTADASGNCEGIAGYDAVTAEAYLVQLSTGDTQAGTQIGVGGCCGIAGIATSAGAVAAVLTAEDDASGSTFKLRRRNVGALGTAIEIATLDIAGQGPVYGHLVRGFGDQHIYIRANRATPVNDTNYKLLRLNVADNTLTELYDYGVATADGFAEDFHHETYDAASVYFNNAAGTGLLKVDHAASSPTTLFAGSTGNQIVNILQAGTRIVVETEGSAGGVYSVAKSGGAPTMLAQDDAVTPKFVTLGATNGAKVFINEASFTSYNARVVNADGSGPLDEADSQWAGQSLQTSCNFAANCEDAASSVAIYLRRTAAASDGFIEVVDPATGAPTGNLIGYLNNMFPGASVFGMGFGRFVQFTAFAAAGHTDIWLGDLDAAAPTAPTLTYVSAVTGDDKWLLFGDGGDEGGGGGGADADGDGLTDSQEASLGTDPNVYDTDGDGLGDGFETGVATNPANPDTDGDGAGDGVEYHVGSNPVSTTNSVYYVDASTPCSVTCDGLSWSTAWPDESFVEGAATAASLSGSDATTMVYVLFAPGTYGGLDLTGGDRQYTAYVGSLGPGVWAPTLPVTTNLQGSTAPDTRALDVDRAYEIQLSGLRLLNGRSALGGGGLVGPTVHSVVGSNTVYLKDVEVTGNISTESGGGLVVTGSNNNLNLERVWVSGNGAQGATAAIAAGGGLLATNAGSLVVYDGKISGNTVECVAPSCAAFGGGAAAIDPGSFISINTSALEGNLASTGAGAGAAGGGAAAYNSAQVDVYSSKVRYNEVNASGVAISAGGGGLAALASGGLTVADTLVSGNLSLQVTPNPPAGGGGGIYADSGGALGLFGSVIADNRAPAGPGGGINLVDNGAVTVTNSRFLSNESLRPGGGLHLHPLDAASFFNNLFVGNVTTDTTLPDGGAVEIDIDNLSAQPPFFNSNTVAFNQVLNVSGGAGGGLSVKNPVGSGSMLLKDNIIWFNQDGTPGSPNTGDNFITDGVISLTSVSSNNIDEGGLPAGINAAGMPADPLFTLGFYLDALSSSIDAGSAPASSVFGAGTYTTDPTGAADAVDLDLGFHFLTASNGTLDGVSVEPPLNCGEHIVRPLFADAPDGAPGHLIGVNPLAAVTLASRTTIDPPGSGDVIAIDRGDGTYLFKATGAGGNANFEIFADDQATPQVVTVFVPSGC